jgi:stage V sporulation protein AB
MYVFKVVIEALFGLCGGSLTAAGYFAVLTSIGIFNRIADVTKTTHRIRLYEEMIILGAVAGNVVSVFKLKVPLGLPGTVVYSLLSGMFIGLFAVCLAESIKAIPIFLRRARIGAGLGYIILMIALGKAVGQLVYYLKLY